MIPANRRNPHDGRQFESAATASSSRSNIVSSGGGDVATTKQRYKWDQRH